nr:DNA gyrase subunit A-like [Lytechinus pictus]
MKNGNIKEQKNKNIVPASFEEEVKKRFLSYALSVIISRALPNVDDGLKPVHRRILFAMSELRLFANKSFKKSARVVGEVIGKYHPHGDAAVYQTMTKMIQDFSINEPLILGHGNFGSIDGDAPAAMRYTEVKLSKIIQEVLNDLPFDTVDFVPNYESSETEPKVLPGIIPLILLNGSKGIAVGMATSIPPHNITEVFRTIIEFIDNPDLTVQEIVERGLMTGPDFPTGALLINTQEEIIKTLETGRGSYKLRAKYSLERYDNKVNIVFTEIPFHINKLRVIESIILLVKQKKINYISDLKDESNRLGIRLIVTVKQENHVDLVLNKLFKMTHLQTFFSVNFLAIHDRKPELMGLIEVLNYYVDHQISVIVRKTKFLLKQDQARIEILQGFEKALNEIDAVIKIIKESATTAEAQKKLMPFLKINERQVKAILEMKLQTLTNFQRTKIFNEIKELSGRIEEFEALLASPEKQKKSLVDRLKELSSKYGSPRKTEIVASDRFKNISEESLILKKRVLICLTKDNYVKRVDLDLFKNQKRGGKGVRGITLNANDKIIEVMEASSHDDLLFFSNNGKVFKIKA